MSIKLKGSTDGSVSLDAPADTSPTGTDVSLTLPTSAGSANQFIKNGSTAGELEHSSMVEDSSGNLGIGVTSPTARLEVQGETTSNSLAAHIKAGDGGNTGALLVDGDGDTGDYLIKARSNTTATPTDSDTRFVVHGDGLVEVNSGYVQLNGTKVGGLQVTIADDAFASFTPPRLGGGFVFITQSGDTDFPGFSCYGTFFADWGSSVKIDLQSLGAGLETNTGGPPNGTTGADNHATFFCGGNSNNRIAYLENRLGQSFAFDITFI